jgi:serine/threonine-protein kinase HSL1 (negative regulator of Swe1 kinase)
LVQEILTLQKADHPNIVKVYEVFKDPSKLYIVMEYIDGLELFDLIRERYFLREEECATIMKQILKTIKYLNSINICHRDLKPENIIVNSKTLQVKIIGKH